MTHLNFIFCDFCETVAPSASGSLNPDESDYRTQKESKSYAEIAEPKNIATTPNRHKF